MNLPEVFISYAHADNPPRYQSRDWEHRRGWVDCLHTTLVERLRQVRGRPTEIWRDDDAGRLGGASILHDTIHEALESCSVFIAVASPSYVASEWCEKEFRSFWNARNERGDQRAGNRLRVLKVQKLPTAPGSFLATDPQVADSVGYAFHRIVDGLPLEFDPPNDGAAGEDFCRRVNALAHDLVAILDTRAEVAPSGTTIFFGACTPDVAARQERIRSELRQYGHEVLPVAAGARLDAPETRAQIARARLSVHIVGAQYDEATVRDYDLVNEAEHGRRVVRLSWLPPDVTLEDQRQRDFVERLRLDANFASITVALEDFKTIVKDRLKVLKPVEVPVPPETTATATVTEPTAMHDVKRVYLIFDPPDREGAKVVDDWLYGQGFEVLKTAPGANASAFRKIHNGRLRSADGVLIYHGNADEQWLEAKIDELWKTFSATRQKHPKARGVVLADPVTPYKSEFRARIARVIPGFGAFDPTALDGFVEDIRRDSDA